MSISVLPIDCVSQIGEYLPLESFFSCLRVSKDFQKKFNNNRIIYFLINKYLKRIDESFKSTDLKINEISTETRVSVEILKIIFCFSKLKLLNSEIQELETLETIIKNADFEENIFNNYIQGCTPMVRSLSFDNLSKFNFCEKIKELRNEFIKLYKKVDAKYITGNFTTEALNKFNCINNAFNKIYGSFPQKRKAENIEIRNQKSPKLR